MARKDQAKTNGQVEGVSRMGAVRQVLQENPKLSANEIAEEVKKKFGLDIEAKTAGVYKYQILTKRKRGRKRRAAGTSPRPSTALTAPATTVAAGAGEGLDELLRAAEKMGWQRVKEVVDKIVQAPG